MFPLTKWHAIWIGAGVALSALAAGAAYRRHAPPPAPVTLTTAPTPLPSRTRPGIVTPLAGPIFVHVTGEVARPGLYRLAGGSRVMDAISNAGGASADADLDALNLATPLRDGQKLVVPRFGEPPPTEQPGFLTDSPVEPPAVLVRADPPPTPAPEPLPEPVEETPMPDVRFTSSQVPDPTPVSATAPARSASHTASAKLRVPGDGVVHLNTASSMELQRLPGVGPATSARILEYRSAHGGFRTVEELMEVKGIGPKKLEKMAPFVVVP